MNTDELSAAELEVLEACFGNDCDPAIVIKVFKPRNKRQRAAVTRLVERGLLEPRDHHGGDRFGKWNVEGLGLTLRGNMVYCQWCGDNVRPIDLA